jgi:hypothetical protein
MMVSIPAVMNITGEKVVLHSRNLVFAYLKAAETYCLECLAKRGKGCRKPWVWVAQRFSSAVGGVFISGFSRWGNP